jgi:chromosome segregation ATPase
MAQFLRGVLGISRAPPPPPPEADTTHDELVSNLTFKIAQYDAELRSIENKIKEYEADHSLDDDELLERVDPLMQRQEYLRDERARAESRRNALEEQKNLLVEADETKQQALLTRKVSEVVNKQKQELDSVDAVKAQESLEDNAEEIDVMAQDMNRPLNRVRHNNRQERLDARRAKLLERRGGGGIRSHTTTDSDWAGDLPSVPVNNKSGGEETTRVKNTVK